MSLFTSNFRTEAKVIGFVMLFMICIEIGVHLFERRMAAGLHTPKASENLMKGEGHRVLILGNSLVRDGIETITIEDIVKNKSQNPMRIEKAFLAASTASDWFYIFKSSFVDKGRLPETLILCFAIDNLQDAALQRPYIAHYYSSWSDIPQIFTNEVHDFDGRSEFLLFKGSLSFSQRRPLQRRVHDVLIPHYRETALRINKPLSDDSERLRQARPQTYRYFERLIKTAEEHNIRVILLAMPAQKPYPIDSKVTEIIQSHRVIFWDHRTIETLKDENFNDEWHLNDSGKKAYTLFLTEKILEQIKP
jgi:hypothetical protein